MDACVAQALHACRVALRRIALQSDVFRRLTCNMAVFWCFHDYACICDSLKKYTIRGVKIVVQSTVAIDADWAHI